MPEAPVFTILGSGFGMYGYLPALIECGMKVALPERYRAVVEGRSELVQYGPQVIWCADREAALARASGAVVALRPADQAEWMARLTEIAAIDELILEKPIAPTPELAARLIDALERTGKRYRVGYTFRFLPWAERLRAVLAKGVSEVSLEWSFMAHHYRASLDNWKKFEGSGGGALRFYGIHLVALLAELGYDEASSSMTVGPSDIEAASWQAIFTSRALPPFRLRVDSRATQTRFTIGARQEGSDHPIVEQLNPFSVGREISVSFRDPRVDVLGKLCRSLGEDDMGHAHRQRKIIALWSQVETVSARGSSVI